MKYKVVVLMFFVAQTLSAQFSGSYFLGQEYSKEVSQYRAKSFLINQVLGISQDILQFEIDALTASSSGELTTLAYKCQMREKEGLIFGFYGNYVNEEGVSYNGYAFKNLPREQAIALLSQISDVMSDYDKYMEEDRDNNNICFGFDDMVIVIYKTDEGLVRLRVQWNYFDSEWTGNSFNKTVKRFEKYFGK